QHFFKHDHKINLKVICGRNEENAREFAETWGYDDVETDWRKVVGRDDIDAVDICTPNNSHREIALACAKAGKMILCEKPLATSADEAQQMVEGARDIPTMVWFNYRRVPAVSFARRLIEEGRLGRIFHYRGFYLQGWGPDPTRPPSWKTDKAQAGSGVLGDLLSHTVDTAMYLNGAISEVTAMQQTFKEGREVDDATLALVRFAGASIGSLEATRYAVGCRNRNAFEIHGERGMLRFNLEDFNHLEFFDATEPGNTQ
ncbi:MAG: Gfo/Idh/MocA family oxidoreductase, partial [bacterium]|nr:Gfo/Idh/MocA family oxidoreductase [bacterium]